MEPVTSEAVKKPKGRTARTAFWIGTIALIFIYGPIHLIQYAKTPFQYVLDDQIPVQLAIRQGFLGSYAVVQFEKGLSASVTVLAIDHLGRQATGYWLDQGVRAGTQLNIGGGEGWTWKKGEEILVCCESGYRPVVWTFEGTQWTRRILYGVEEADYLDRIASYEKRPVR